MEAAILKTHDALHTQELVFAIGILKIGRLIKYFVLS